MITFVLLIWLPLFTPVESRPPWGILIPFGYFPPVLAAGFLLAHFSGGIVAGRMSFAWPGLHGVLTALLSPALLVLGLLSYDLIYNVAVRGVSAVASEIASELSGASLRETLADEESAGLFFLDGFEFGDLSGWGATQP